MPLQWRNQFWQSLEEGARKRCRECGRAVLSSSCRGPHSSVCRRGVIGWRGGGLGGVGGQGSETGQWINGVCLCVCCSLGIISGRALLCLSKFHHLFGQSASFVTIQHSFFSPVLMLQHQELSMVPGTLIHTDSCQS